MWTPDLRLNPAPGFALLILVLHVLVLVVVVWMGGYWLAPLPVLAGIYHGGRDGLKVFPDAVTRVWLAPQGWYLARRDGRQLGPFHLGTSSRVDSGFVRLSLMPVGAGVLHRWRSRHLMLTPAMTGAESFRRLQVFLRWAPDKNQVPDIAR